MFVRLSRPRAAVALVAALLASALVVLVPQQANAAYGCTGDWVSRQPFNDIDGRSVATVERYEGGSSSDCFALVSRGQYAGVSKYMSFTICSGDTDSTCRSNSGNFGSYAGPLTAVSCTSAWVIIRDPGGRTILHFRTYVGSCN